MPRIIRIAACQMGPNQRTERRKAILSRMIALLERAAAQGATLCVFPELAFTTFFPRWYLEGAELDQYYEPAMPNPRVKPLFDRARALGIGFSVGYAEITAEASTLDDEVILADCDLDLCQQGKSKMFDLGAHRQPSQYGPITEGAGVIEPA